MLSPLQLFFLIGSIYLKQIQCKKNVFSLLLMFIEIRWKTLSELRHKNSYSRETSGKEESELGVSFLLANKLP